MTGNDHLFPILNSSDKLGETVLGFDDGDVHGCLDYSQKFWPLSGWPSISHIMICTYAKRAGVWLSRHAREMICGLHLFGLIGLALGGDGI